MNRIARKLSTVSGVASSYRKIITRSIALSSARRDIFKVQDEEDFKLKVLQSKEPVIIDFYATWCGPCKILLPKLETVVGGTNNKVHLAKIDIDEQEGLAMKYNVAAVPTVVAIKNGKVTDQFSGLRDDDQIRAFVEKLSG